MGYIRNFLMYLKLAKRLMQQTNRSKVYLKGPTERDKLDLSIGRWETFKATHAPEFTVKMTVDGECILKQHCLRVAHQYRTAGITGTFRPNADDALKATELCIYHITNCQQNSLLLEQYLIDLTRGAK